MCFTFIPQVYATDNVNEGEIVTNEYEAIKSLSSESTYDLSEQGYSKEEVNKIKDYKNVFIEYFNELKEVDDAKLVDMGYTNEQINILRNFNGDEYEIELLAATMTLTIPIESVTWSASQKRTNAKLKVNFSWSTMPVFNMTDIVGISWNDWTLASSSSSITYRKKVGTASTIKGSATKVNNQGPKSFGLGYRFNMNANSNQYYAKNGSFSISLYHNNYKKDLSVHAKYGHNQASVTPSVFIPGYGSLNFSTGIKTVAQQWNDRACK